MAKQEVSWKPDSNDSSNREISMTKINLNKSILSCIQIKINRMTEKIRGDKALVRETLLVAKVIAIKYHL